MIVKAKVRTAAPTLTGRILSAERSTPMTAMTKANVDRSLVISFIDGIRASVSPAVCFPRPL